MRAGLNAQLFGIIVTLAGFLTLVLVLRNDLVDGPPALNVFPPRQVVSMTAPVNVPPAVATFTTTAYTSLNLGAVTSASTAALTQPVLTLPIPTPAQQSTSQAVVNSSSTLTNTAAAPGEASSTLTSALVTTDQGGQVVTSVAVVFDSSSAPSQTSAISNSGSSGHGSGIISTSTIIALSVVGGVAMLGLIGFFAWKFTRRQIGEFDNRACSTPSTYPHYSHASSRVDSRPQLNAQIRRLSGQTLTPVSPSSTCQKAALTAEGRQSHYSGIGMSWGFSVKDYIRCRSCKGSNHEELLALHVPLMGPEARGCMRSNISQYACSTAPSVRIGA